MDKRLNSIDLDMLAYDISDTLDRNEYDLDLNQDDLRAGLVAYLEAALAHADCGTETTVQIPAQFADAPRAKSHGGFVHVDTDGSVLHQVPFGHKREMGPERCARCWELENGGEPREDYAPRRRDLAKEAAELSAAIRAHDCKARGCGSVCTAFDW